MHDQGISFQLSDNQMQIIDPNNIIDVSSKENKKITRRKFCPDEDNVLKTLVATFGSNDWKIIASHFPNRTARQCRERWKHYLSPNVVVGNWTDDENNLLLKKHQEFGAQWSVIAKFFPGRTDIGIKNHYISLTTKKLKSTNSKVHQRAILLPNSVMLNNDAVSQNFQSQFSKFALSEIASLDQQSSLGEISDDNCHQNIFHQIQENVKNSSEDYKNSKKIQELNENQMPIQLI